jgi:hypothetical protein
VSFNAKVITFLGAFLSFVTAWPSQATQLPINDNTSPPYVGVSESGPNMDADQFYIWLNRNVNTIIIGTGLSYAAWTDIQGDAWVFRQSGPYLASHPHSIPTVGVPLLPGTTGNPGVPLAGTSLAMGATGAYNSNFSTLAQNLVNGGMSNAIIRLGWEFNGNWYPWNVATDADAKNFAAYWVQVVTAMRKVPGANFKFLWNGANYKGITTYPVSDAFPTGNDGNGKPYVDYVGVDVYDTCGGGNYTTEAAAWSGYMYPTRYNGIQTWQTVAINNNVPLTFPEWGLTTGVSGGGDDPAFITQMFNYIQNSTNNVYYASYYDNNGGSLSQISPVRGYTTTYPNSADTFNADFNVGGSPVYTYTFSPVYSTISPLMMDPNGGNAGNQLELNNPTDLTGQIWVVSYSSANTHTPGVYRISPYGSSNLSVTTSAAPINGSTVTLHPETGASYQRWFMLTQNTYDDVAFASATTPQFSTNNTTPPSTNPPGSAGQWLSAPTTATVGALLTTEAFSGTYEQVRNGQAWNATPISPASETPALPVWAFVVLAALLTVLATRQIKLTPRKDL